MQAYSFVYREVRLLATSRISSNSPDLVDVSAVMEAFQQINNCLITLHGRVVSVRGAQELVMIVSALELPEDSPDHTYLASVNVHLGSGQHRTMEGAILWGLYQLDWELSRIGRKKNEQPA